MSMWETMGPGLLTAGLGWYNANQAESEAQKRADALKNDPMQQQLQQAQMAELARAGAVDPAARFAQQQGILQPLKDKSEADMFRKLHAKGMLGLATDAGAGKDPLTGQMQTWQNTPGLRANPQMAAFYAARAGQESKDAYAALAEAEAARTAAFNRAQTLGQQRTSAVTTAKSLQPNFSKAGAMSGMFDKVAGMLGNKDVLGAIGGLFGRNSPVPGPMGPDSNGSWDVLPAPSIPQIDFSFANGSWDLPSFDFTMPRFDFGSDFGGYDSWGF